MKLAQSVIGQAHLGFERMSLEKKVTNWGAISRTVCPSACSLR
ncbi:hypothetical protein ACG04R_23995 [Roseateles sp. BYS78W]|uniref:Uncharacterized protein n=1 Tax=Pelomonas candidula TaxID=3299025 RepID=A0ABW7HIS1_9BURK